MGDFWHGQQFVRRMWEHFTIKEARAKSAQVDAEKERQEVRGGVCQQESPCKEELELVKHNRDLRFESLLIRRACKRRNVRWLGKPSARLPERREAQCLGKHVKVRECYNEDRSRGRRAADSLRRTFCVKARIF